MIEFLARLEPRYLLDRHRRARRAAGAAARHRRRSGGCADLQLVSGTLLLLSVRSGPRHRHRRRARRREPAHLQPPDHEQEAARVAMRQLGAEAFAVSVQPKGGARAALRGAAGTSGRSTRAVLKWRPHRPPCRLRYRVPSGAAVGPLLRRQPRSAAAKRTVHGLAERSAGRFLGGAAALSRVPAARRRALRQRGLRADGRGRGIRRYGIGQRPGGASCERRRAQGRRRRGSSNKAL